MDLQQLLQLERDEKTTSARGPQIESCYVDTENNPETAKAPTSMVIRKD